MVREHVDELRLVRGVEQVVEDGLGQRGERLVGGREDGERPAPESVSTRPPALSAVTSVERSGVALHLQCFRAPIRAATLCFRYRCRHSARAICAISVAMAHSAYHFQTRRRENQETKVRIKQLRILYSHTSRSLF